MRDKIIFNWSGGKDSAYCLYQLQQNKEDILCLLTSVNEHYQRISMHGVRTQLLEQQCKQIGLPLVKMMVPEMPDMQVYEQAMTSVLSDLKNQGATAAAFGDIFLEDLRRYREEKLAQLELKALFPIWKVPTLELARSFIAEGFKSIITCVDGSLLDQSFAGRLFDESFLQDLPANVDPCGENGEFHSFVFDGPIFKDSPVAFTKGDLVLRSYADPSASGKQKGFWYCDLLPAWNAPLSSI